MSRVDCVTYAHRDLQVRYVHILTDTRMPSPLQPAWPREVNQPICERPRPGQQFPVLRSPGAVYAMPKTYTVPVPVLRLTWSCTHMLARARGLRHVWTPWRSPGATYATPKTYTMPGLRRTWSCGRTCGRAGELYHAWTPQRSPGGV